MPEPNIQQASLVEATVDFDVDGLQHGFLIVANPQGNSAWDTVRVPLTVIKKGKGPCALIVGGKHGNDYVGPVAILRLAQEISETEVDGTIILIPNLNPPAMQAGSRLSPLDQSNLDRLFPGNPEGSVSCRIADYLSRCIIPMADLVLDLHSGGSTLDFAPFASVHVQEDQALQQAAEALMIAFGAPNSLRMPDPEPEGMLATEVARQGKPFVGAGLGGGATATLESLRIAHTGCINVLIHAGIVHRDLQLRSTRMLEIPDQGCLVYANESGLLEMRASLDGDVYRGDPLAFVHASHRTGVKPAAYVAERNGILLARHHPGLIQPGDCLAIIAEEVQR